jgi:DNA repair exonuclease SbcCD ATPase subunit
MDFINQYGPTVGLTILVTMAILPVLKALGIGQAAKMTASANETEAKADTVQAKAELVRVEGETQRSMNRMTDQLFDQQRVSNDLYIRQADDLKKVEVKLAELLGEYTAYQKMDAERSKSWQQQTELTEELRQLEKKNTARLEAEVSNLRGDVERALNALNIANAISEERRKENEELKIINDGLLEDKGELFTKMQELAGQIELLEKENNELRGLPGRVQELERQNANLQQQITELRAKYEAHPTAVEQPELAMIEIEGVQG